MAATLKPNGLAKPRSGDSSNEKIPCYDVLHAHPSL